MLLHRFATGTVTTKSAEDIAFGEIETYLANLESQLANVKKHVAAVVQRRQGRVHLVAAFVL